MTDRLSGFIVALDENIRDDDAETIRVALSMIRGVVDVKPVVADHSLAIAEMRVKNELRTKLYDFISTI